MKKRVLKIIFISLDVIIILVVIYFFLGFLNFNMIKNNKSPLFEFKAIEKKDNSKKITTYNYGLYKIVKNEKIGSTQAVNRGGHCKPA